MAEGIVPAVGLAPARRLRPHVPAVLTSTASSVFFLGVVPALLSLPAVLHAVSGSRRGSDFLSFWNAGRRVFHGHSPYPLLDALPAIADLSRFEPFVYPAPAAFALVPFAVLPFAVAATLWLAASMAAIVGALRLLAVRDWRCHGAVFASVPVIAATSLGTFTPFLLLGVAAAWRYRDRASRVGLVVAALVVAKVFLWPIWLWLVYTRRFGAAAVAAAAGAAATFGAWALIGFEGLRDYPRMLSRLTELVGTQSYSPYALLRAASVGGRQTHLAVVLIVVVAAGVAWNARTGDGDRVDEQSFLFGLGAALALTPILWPHYLVLLYVPIALARTRFSALWLLPLLLWLDASGSSDASPLRIAPVLCLATMVFVSALRTSE
jgi:Glycosyltransferase family 87